MNHAIPSESDYFARASAAWDQCNLELALLLFRIGAERGDASCQHNLGYFYDDGVGVDSNKNIALHWYRHAYRQGESSSATNIAIIWKEKGNYTRSLWWFHRAVRLGDGDALIEIARIHEQGLGVPRSVKLANHYYKRAASHAYITEDGHETALAWLNPNGDQQKN